MSKVNFFVISMISLLLISGCGGESGDAFIENTNPNIPPGSSPENWYKPLATVKWQWQLQGDVNTSYDVELYDIDLFDSSKFLISQLQANGKKVICYFSAGSYESWRTDADQFSVADIGQTLDGFQDERWLDVRSIDVREIMKKRLDLAKEKGCDGVEPDNVDGYANNTGLNLAYDDQLNFNRFLANEAHARNLSMGLKNNLYQVNDLVNYFDFAVNEQCFEYSECGLLEPFVEQNKPVLHVEFSQALIADQETADNFCFVTNSFGFSSMVLPFALDDSFRFSCF